MESITSTSGFLTTFLKMIKSDGKIDNMSKSSFRIIEHTADVGIEVEGETLEELFKTAALGMIHIIFGKVFEDEKPTLTRQVETDGPEKEDILNNFLSEVLYLIEAERFIPIRFLGTRIEEDQENFRFSTVAWGMEFDPQKHQMKTEIKAVTFHQMDVHRQNDRWKTRIIFDI